MTECWLWQIFKPEESKVFSDTSALDNSVSTVQMTNNDDRQRWVSIPDPAIGSEIVQMVNKKTGRYLTFDAINGRFSVEEKDAG